MFRGSTGRFVEFDDTMLAPGLPQAVRAVDDGFLLVFESAETNSDNSELLHVGLDGEVTHVCTYADLPKDTNVHGLGVLDPAGRFYQTGWRLEPDLIIRRTTEGGSEVIFDAATIPFPFQIYRLVTGP
jgi:hypothetical protein